MHWLAILIQSSAFHFNDGLVWLGPGGQNLDDLAFDPQSISRPRWLGPRQFTTQSNNPIAQRRSSGDQKTHRHCRGMPAARGQPPTIAELEKKAAEYEEKAKTEPNRVAIRLREKAKLCYVVQSRSVWPTRGTGTKENVLRMAKAVAEARVHEA